MSRRRSTTTASSWVYQLVPFSAPIVAMTLGLGVGGAIGWGARGEQSFGAMLREPRLEGLDDACAPVLEEQKTRLTEIREQLAGLEGQVADREAQVVALKAKLDVPGLSPEAAAELERSLADAKETLAGARLEVRSLRRTKDKLVDELSATQAELEETATELEAEAAIREALQSEKSQLVEQAITQRWLRTVTEAQLDVCERVGRRRASACRDAVVGELTQLREEFVHCLRSNQAAPSVRRVERGERLPSHVRVLDPDDRFLGGWYVQLCDPTLPEADVEP